MLIVVSSPKFFENEVVILNTLFKSGMELLHLRKPDSSIEDLRNLISLIDKKYLQKIVLHQHFELLKEFGLTRLHLTENVRKETSEKHLLEWNKEGIHLSTSIHSLKDLALLESSFGYAIIGPVFPSISKANYVPKENLIDLVSESPNRKIKLVAIGGITHENKNQLNHFDGVALHGILWKDPENAILEFEKCRQKENTFSL